MKHTTYLFLILSSSIFSQGIIETSFIKKNELHAERLVSINNFGTTYYVEKNVFYKKDTDKVISYSNLQLGDLTSVSTFNSLKINLFYKDFNTVIILDNRLAEIFKIDFNTKQPYRNVSLISMGPDNTVWLFNQDSQQLELYDYKLNNTRMNTLPIQDRVIDMKSNYNYCYLLTDKALLIYNYFGSLIGKIKNEGFTSLSENNENIILKKENALFFLKKHATSVLPIELPNLLINAFFVTNETLYLYDSEILHEFHLKIN